MVLTDIREVASSMVVKEILRYSKTFIYLNKVADDLMHDEWTHPGKQDDHVHSNNWDEIHESFSLNWFKIFFKTLPNRFQFTSKCSFEILVLQLVEF